MDAHRPPPPSSAAPPRIPKAPAVPRAERDTLPEKQDPIADLLLVVQQLRTEVAELREEVRSLRVENRELRVEVDRYARHMEQLQSAGERYAQSAMEFVTRVEQLTEQLKRSELRCELRHHTPPPSLRAVDGKE